MLQINDHESRGCLTMSGLSAGIFPVRAHNGQVGFLCYLRLGAGGINIRVVKFQIQRYVLAESRDEIRSRSWASVDCFVPVLGIWHRISISSCCQSYELVAVLHTLKSQIEKIGITGCIQTWINTHVVL